MLSGPAGPPEPPLQGPLPHLRGPLREPLPIPLSLQEHSFAAPRPPPPPNGQGAPPPYPLEEEALAGSASHDEQLRAKISDRFVDAYAAQIGYLQHAAVEEMTRTQHDIEVLRNVAYTAQKSAAEQAMRAQMAQAELSSRAATSQALREAIQRVQEEVRAEAAAVAANHAAIRHKEQELSQTEAAAQAEARELVARCNFQAKQRQAESEKAAELTLELATAREEHIAEVQAARDEARRTEAAIAEGKQAKAGLAWRDTVAERTLKEAVERLEADFARERSDWVEQEKRSMSRLQEMQREAQRQSLGQASWRALARPQAMLQAAETMRSSSVTKPALLKPESPQLESPQPAPTEPASPQPALMQPAPTPGVAREGFMMTPVAPAAIVTAIAPARASPQSVVTLMRR